MLQTDSLYPELFFYFSNLDVLAQITHAIIRNFEKEEISCS